MAWLQAQRRKPVLVTAGVLFIVGLGAAAGLMNRADAPATGPVAAAEIAQPVRVTPIAFQPDALTASYTGTIRPRHEAPLGFRVGGKVVARLVDVGDTVTKGQVVARLDDTDAQLELDQAQAELTAARIDLDRARAEVARNSKLSAAGFTAQATLDRSTSTLAEAQSRADRAARSLALAQNRLAYTELAADADGIVTETPAEVGQVVSAGQSVVSVAETGAPDVVFALPEQDRGQLAGATARAELWGVEGKSYALTLRDISPDVDPTGRTYRVRMTLAAPDADAALGRTVTIHLSLGTNAPVAAVPLAAVMNDGSGASVWRIAGESVERVPVTLAAVTGEVAMIRGTLADGDRIVSLGTHKIDPARPVRVVETFITPES